MADCRLCERSGLFLSLTANGLCKSCDPIVAMDVTQRARILGDSVRLVMESSKLDTRVSRCDLILQHATALINYERCGIPTLNPLPSTLAREYRDKRDTIVLEGLEKLVADGIAKADLITNPKAKIGHVSKVLFKLRQYKDEYQGKIGDPTLLDGLEARLKDTIHGLQLNSYLEAAEKAAFKGQRKKALDQYYEALYFLKHDDIQDTLQTGNIAAIEAKIVELGGTSVS
jgi:hypothetical protein